MASNGGTLHGGPQNQISALHSCSLCGVSLESANSLQVHMHYHHSEGGSNNGRWSATTTTMSSTTPTLNTSSASPDTENNNNPVGSKGHHIKASNSPIAAAADSSDQPGTPQLGGESTYSPLPYQSTLPPTDMHPYPPAYLGYHEQYYHHAPMGYGEAPLPPPQFHQEYKTVPSRYHPYNNNNGGAKNGMSPKIVSSSGSMDSMFESSAASSSPGQNGLVPPGQPTPSPSPKQCDKCGTVCETDGQLMEHCARAHPQRPDDDLETGYFGQQQQQSYVKVEDSTGDILDLDSQKMVYPQHPMMHLQQSMQRHPMMWEPTQFQAPPSGSAFKTEYPPTPPIKSEYSQKLFNGSEGEAPQDFPSTTTPQDASGFRNFEPASTTLGTKSTAWKSNEARRPKTYNCTACNKWFTSSGHLKRHYNTTLHKNAVKSSGAPDPALTPISHHHHPNRDPNYSGKPRRSQPTSASSNQSQEPPRSSPEYGSGGGGGQYPLASFQSQGFSQYQPINGGHPNGLAGPSVLASQPRGLLINSSTLNNLVEPLLMEQPSSQQQQQMDLPQQQQQQQQQLQQPLIISTISSPHIIPDSSGISTGEGQPLFHHIISHPSAISTSTIQSYQVTQSEEAPQSYPHIIGNSEDLIKNEGATTLVEYHQNLFQGDMAPPFSPDVPTDMYTWRFVDDHQGPMQAEMAPATSPAPCSPSSTTTSLPTDPQPLSQQPSVAEMKKSGVFRCHQCDKVFNKICYLTQHNKTFHSGDKPFKCTRCGKRFPCEEASEEHFAKHTGSKPFKCEICPKEFNHKTDLRRHMCVHTGSKPFCCSQCGKGFIRKDHMIKHTETHRKKEALLANKKAAVRNRQLKKVQMYDTNTSGSDISNASSCKTDPMIF